MARRPSIIKLKAKAQKKSKTEQYVINSKCCGNEPTFTSKPLTRNQHELALSWYNYMSDKKEGREFLVHYLKSIGRESDAKRIKEVPDQWLHLTVCWLARIMSRGAQIEESSREFFNDRLSDMINRDYSKSDKMLAESEETVPVKKVERTVQDRIKTILNDQIAEIEEEVDKFGDNLTNSGYVSDFKMYEWLQGREVSSANAKRMYDYYNPQLEEIEEAWEGIVNRKPIDAQLKEGYSGYSKTQLTKLFGFFVMIIEDLEQYTNNTKKVRKTRTKKPITAEKKLKDFKHQQFDNLNKIQSVQPEKILGASELWTFSTKYNQLTVFRSSDPSGLDVHRTSITNFDPAQSTTKKLRAKDVPVVLKGVLEAGKVSLRTILKNARGSDQKLQERMNENTILLRVVK